MKRIKSMSVLAVSGGTPGQPAEGLTLSGNPRFMTNPLPNDFIDVGVWEATPGHHRVIRGKDFTECFYLVEGSVELSEEETGEAQVFGPGDMVIIEPEFVGTWKTLSPLRKVYFGLRG